MNQKQPENFTSGEFGRLFAQYRVSFTMVARSYVRDVMVAEDLVMDSFISFWENRDRIEDEQNIPSYILTTLKRRCLNWLRDQSTRLKAEEEIQSTTLRIMSSRISTLETNDPDSLFLQEMSTIIRHEIENMPAQTRKVFLANRFEEIPYKKIAEKFGLSFNQVSFEMRKATQLLRQALKDYLPLLFIVLKLWILI